MDDDSGLKLKMLSGREWIGMKKGKLTAGLAYEIGLQQRRAIELGRKLFVVR